jgi:hypothetical protein
MSIRPLAVAALLLVLLRAAPAVAADAWYVDVSGHWAEPYISVLWAEGLTDGWEQGTQVWFRPDTTATRAEYAVLLAKAFRLEPIAAPVPYSDVGPATVINGVRPAYGFLAAAYARGILPAAPSWYPHEGLTRAEAITLLVSALSLSTYAEALSPLDVALALYAFSDHHQVPDEARIPVAAAVRLGIIQGYDDGTVRPLRLMTRAEAVTMLYRSCVLLLRIDPPAFSPDGDHIDDETLIVLDVLKNRNAHHWNLYITDSRGAVFTYFNHAPGATGPPPAQVTWDGRTTSGTVLPPGTYFARGWVTDRHNTVHWSVAQPVTLVEYRVWGHAVPGVIRPGDELALHAYTSAAASSVAWQGAVAPELPAVPVAGSGGREWLARLLVPTWYPDGAHTLLVEARFASGAIRRAQALFVVSGELALTGWVHPDPCYPGQELTVGAEASPEVVAVRASFSDGERLELEFRDGHWQGGRVLPSTLEPGIQVVELEAVATGRRRCLQLVFNLEVDPRDGYTFIITD